MGPTFGHLKGNSKKNGADRRANPTDVVGYMMTDRKRNDSIQNGAGNNVYQYHKKHYKINCYNILK